MTITKITALTSSWQSSAPDKYVTSISFINNTMIRKKLSMTAYLDKFEPQSRDFCVETISQVKCKKPTVSLQFVADQLEQYQEINLDDFARVIQSKNTAAISVALGYNKILKNKNGYNRRRVKITKKKCEPQESKKHQAQGSNLDQNKASNLSSNLFCGHSYGDTLDTLNIKESTLDSGEYEPNYESRKVNLNLKLGIVNTAVNILVDIPIGYKAVKKDNADVKTQYIVNESNFKQTYHENLSHSVSLRLKSNRSSSSRRISSARKQLDGISEISDCLKGPPKTFSGLTFEQKRKAQSLAVCRRDKLQATTKPTRFSPEKLTVDEKEFYPLAFNNNEECGPLCRTFSKMSGKQWEDLDDDGEVDDCFDYCIITPDMPVIVPPSLRKMKVSNTNNDSSGSSESSFDLGDIQRRQTMRMRKVLPTPDPRKLCFKTNMAGCTHSEVKQAIESQSGAKVVWMQYDPMIINSKKRGEKSSLWIFQLAADEDVQSIIFQGFTLRGTEINVRRLDDIYREEYAAYTMCSKVYTEQRRRRLTQRSARYTKKNVEEKS